MFIREALHDFQVVTESTVKETYRFVVDIVEDHQDFFKKIGIRLVKIKTDSKEYLLVEFHTIGENPLAIKIPKEIDKKSLIELIGEIKSTIIHFLESEKNKRDQAVAKIREKGTI